jgi:phage shock protein E
MGSVLRAIVALCGLVLVLVISSCGTSEANGTVQRVGPVEAVRLIAEGDRPVIDLRSPRDYAAAHVAGAVNIDASASDFDDRVVALDEHATYLVYAASKAQSAPAADEMVRLGVDHVVDAGAFGLLALAGAELAD